MVDVQVYPLGALRELAINAPWAAQSRPLFVRPDEPESAASADESERSDLGRAPVGDEKSRPPSTSGGNEQPAPLHGVDADEALQALADEWWKQHRTFASLLGSLDADHDNTISPHELERALAQLGLSISPEQLRLVVMTFDHNHDGRISRNEVVRVILSRKPQGDLPVSLAPFLACSF